MLKKEKKRSEGINTILQFDFFPFFFDIKYDVLEW